MVLSDGLNTYSKYAPDCLGTGSRPCPVQVVNTPFLLGVPFTAITTSQIGGSPAFASGDYEEFTYAEVSFSLTEANGIPVPINLVGTVPGPEPNVLSLTTTAIVLLSGLAIGARARKWRL
jgi:hypothetical protein